MRDIKFIDIIHRLEAESPVKLPRGLTRKIIYSSMKFIFKMIQRDENQIALYDCAIKRIFEIHNGSRYEAEFMDLDETKLLPRNIAIKLAADRWLENNSYARKKLYNAHHKKAVREWYSSFGKRMEARRYSKSQTSSDIDDRETEDFNSLYETEKSKSQSLDSCQSNV